MSKVIKLPEVLLLTKVSKSKWYGEIKKGNAPKPIKLGDRAVAWVAQDVTDWIDNRIKQSKQDIAV